ncbi:MAG: hypothetical protein RBQ67_08195 [Candidatus Cloacimonadaceae bacterium]|nr:hypothetical protein [Candidatus Cloacimonadota bacterium]MDY0319956.1 hypothetical protein [Candidatus Cloacimonadaceae bacterium]HQB98517.1 hypothetical protein [Candidatus Cloacimonadota bacterium]
MRFQRCRGGLSIFVKWVCPELPECFLKSSCAVLGMSLGSIKAAALWLMGKKLR